MNLDSSPAFMIYIEQPSGTADMKIIEFKDVLRKDVPIYYRRHYTGIAVLDLLNKLNDVPIDFQIEHKPTGHTEISITKMASVDYPLVPLQRELKNFIKTLDSGGKLPN